MAPGAVSVFQYARAQLLDRVCRGLNFAIHEWPAGLCCDMEEIESELRFARTLDSENRLTEFFRDVESILAEAREWANRRMEVNG